MRRVAGLSCGWTLAGCIQSLDEETTRIEHEQVLGVLAEPAEAGPGMQIALQLIVAGPDGPIDDARATWTLCRTPKALSEPGFASEACVRGVDAPLPSRGPSATTEVPRDACTLFSGANDADLRPRDPDLTGGYYQPVRVSPAGTEPVLARVRLLCPLSDAPIAIAQAYTRRYVPNTSPAISAFTIDGAEAAGATLLAGVEVELSMQVLPDSLERFVVYDRNERALTERTEALTAAWFVTAGELAAMQSSVATDGSARTRWRTPDAGASVQIWVLVRDDRGGLGYRTERVSVADAP